ncbi:hypothetical protein, partial [Staphylococcus aureus]|uniref:hypothetical protein n=1 Tax=Staphylococcus aureus TaxID=1280 RepID=UPI0005C61055
ASSDLLAYTRRTKLYTKQHHNSIVYTQKVLVNNEQHWGVVRTPVLQKTNPTLILLYSNFHFEQKLYSYDLDWLLSWN